VNAPLHSSDQRIQHKIENLGHAVALHFMFCNFGRIHKTLRVTPAMEAGIADHVWILEDIAALVKAKKTEEARPL